MLDKFNPRLLIAVPNILFALDNNIFKDKNQEALKFVHFYGAIRFDTDP